MFEVAKDDVLRGLKKFKRLAKQDLLASSLTSNPRFWSSQAEARRNMYDELMAAVEEKGVELAYRQAARAYANLPLHNLSPAEDPDPQITGKQQALEMFFTILGVNKEGQRHRCSPNNEEASDGMMLNATP
ncbi:MAG: hypothetical protein GX165_00770 [Firmicutes bacterium]|jgi:hypothetical protein|nr:hypothetical protein [Bacillota bacterium]